MNKIVLICPERNDVSKWVENFKKENNNIEVEIYPNDTDRDQTEFVATWNPPADAFEKFTNLKVIASMAAGVKHITSKKIPNNVKVTRVKDDYLNYDLSYFVLNALLNYLRDMPLYFQHQQEKIWDRQIHAY